MYDNILKQDLSPKFLGISFYNKLSFKNHIKFVKSTCANRINILKILKHKRWRLNNNINSRIYKLLIGSIFDYSLFFYPSLSIYDEWELQKTQNKALKIIFRVNELAELYGLASCHGIVNLSDRAKSLRLSYLQRALDNENELIVDLCRDYVNYNFKKCSYNNWNNLAIKKNKKFKYETLLDGELDLIEPTDTKSSSLEDQSTYELSSFE
jgi:hypothetical protein